MFCRVEIYICKHIRAVDHPERVAGEPAGEGGVVVPVRCVILPRERVEVQAREPVPDLVRPAVGVFTAERRVLEAAQ